MALVNNCHHLKIKFTSADPKHPWLYCVLAIIGHKCFTLIAIWLLHFGNAIWCYLVWKLQVLHFPIYWDQGIVTVGVLSATEFNLNVDEGAKVTIFNNGRLWHDLVRVTADSITSTRVIRIGDIMLFLLLFLVALNSRNWYYVACRLRTRLLFRQRRFFRQQ